MALWAFNSLFMRKKLKFYISYFSKVCKRVKRMHCRLIGIYEIICLSSSCFFCPTREHTEPWIANFDEIWHECSFQKNIRPIFLLSAMVDFEAVKTTFKFGGVKHILLNGDPPKICQVSDRSVERYHPCFLSHRL